jgi:transposase-like protein
MPRVYDREFKLAVCRQWAAGERTCAQLVREHGIAQSILYRWRAAYAAYGEAAFQGQPGPLVPEPGTSTSEAVLLQRIAELERALGKIALENEILKKGRSLAASRSGTP